LGFVLPVLLVCDGPVRVVLANSGGAISRVVQLPGLPVLLGCDGPVRVAGDVDGGLVVVEPAGRFGTAGGGELASRRSARRTTVRAGWLTLLL